MVARHGPEELRGDPRDGRLLAGDRFGQLAHALIADLAPLQRPAREHIVAAVSRALRERDSANPALRRRLTDAAVTYFALFAPAHARLVGAELAVGGQRLDLVWRSGSVVWADELKCAGDQLTSAITQQCARQLSAGRSCWGAAFAGVRVIWLQPPGRALVVDDRDHTL
jgi:hypothetical protein